MTYTRCKISVNGTLHPVSFNRPGCGRMLASMRRKLRPTFIKHWRIHRGLTQAQLADKVSMHQELSHVSISRIEKGQQPYTQHTIELIAEALETDVVSLLSRDPDQAPVDDDAINPLWQKADAAQRAQIFALSEAIVKWVPKPPEPEDPDK